MLLCPTVSPLTLRNWLCSCTHTGLSSGAPFACLRRHCMMSAVSVDDDSRCISWRALARRNSLPAVALTSVSMEISIADCRPSSGGSDTSAGSPLMRGGSDAERTSVGIGRRLRRPITGFPRRDLGMRDVSLGSMRVTRRCTLMWSLFCCSTWIAGSPGVSSIVNSTGTEMLRAWRWVASARRPHAAAD